MKHVTLNSCPFATVTGGGCVKTRRIETGMVLRYAGSTRGKMGRTQGSVSVSSAEFYAMVSASEEAKQVQDITLET